MRLAQPQADGCTLRQHLLRGAQATGRAHPMLQHRPPVAAQHLWGVFCDLSGQRSPGAAIALSEIEAWQRLHRTPLTSWEVDCITAMDQAAMALAADLRAKQRKPQ